MFPLFETARLLDGEIIYPEHHRKRFLQSYQTYYKKQPPYDIFQNVNLDLKKKKGIFKIKVAYNATQTFTSITPYKAKKVVSLQMVYDNNIGYPLKYTDRQALEQAWQQRGNLDDVLIIKNGFLTDTYYANIVLFDGTYWHTPTTYLLNGTCRQRLLASNLVRETPIHANEIYSYVGFQLINAMLDFNPDKYQDINGIHT